MKHNHKGIIISICSLSDCNIINDENEQLTSGEQKEKKLLESIRNL